jgi:hypothetical protein
MPSQTPNGKIACPFQRAGKFKNQYSTAGFRDETALDDGHLWPSAHALTRLTPREEEQIVVLLRRGLRRPGYAPRSGGKGRPRASGPQSLARRDPPCASGFPWMAHSGRRIHPLGPWDPDGKFPSGCRAVVRRRTSSPHPKPGGETPAALPSPSATGLVGGGGVSVDGPSDLIRRAR